MVGNLRMTAEGNGHVIWPLVREERIIETPICDGCNHVQEKFCAELRLNGHSVPFSLDGCWCAIFSGQPADEVIFNLGKSVLDGLINYPLKGQDGSLLVLVELHI